MAMATNDNRNPGIGIPVNVYDLDGNFLMSYDSISMAARILKLNEGRVWKCVKEGFGRAGQYQIRYKSPLEDSLARIPIDPYKEDRFPKPVDVFDLKGKYIMTCQSISEASRKLNTNINSIRRCVQGKYHRAGQYQIRYKSPLEDSLARIPIDPHKEDSFPKPVDVFDLKGKYIMTCQSIREASRKLNTHPCSIRRCVQGKCHRAGQYIFRKKKEPRKKANTTLEKKLYLVRVVRFESNVRTGILYRLVPYTGENRCVKCAFAYDERNCAKHKCTTPDGKNGYFSFFCEESRRDYFVAQV